LQEIRLLPFGGVSAARAIGFLTHGLPDYAVGRPFGYPDGCGGFNAISVLARQTRALLLRECVDVFFARAEVAVEGALEVGLNAREFQDAKGVALEVDRWVETAV